MVTKSLKEDFRSDRNWPESAQEEAAATLEAIEEDLVSPHPLNDDDRAALERSADDVRHGRFATDDAVRNLFGRFHRA